MKARQCVTETNLLTQFPATIALKELGITQNDLDRVYFHPRDRNLPIAQRPVRIPAQLLARWDLTLPDCPPVLSLIRDYVVYRYAIRNGYTEEHPDFDGAWRHHAERISASLIEDRLSYLIRQKEHARRPRGVIPEIKMTIYGLVAEYANKPENLPLKPSELWPGFEGYMREYRLDPVLENDAYEYIGGRTIAYPTFCNYVRKAREQH